MKQKTLPILTFLCLFTAAICLPGHPATAGVFSVQETQGMFDLYQENRAKGIPNYITEDFILLAYTMVLNEAVTELEEKTLQPHFQELVDGLIAQVPKSDPATEAAKDCRNFLSILSCLLSGKEQPEQAADPAAATAELKKILAANGASPSELMGQIMDYTQFRVRGKYTRNETLSRYFRAVRYAGTAFFPLLSSKATGISPEDADRLTEQALLLSRLIMENPRLKEISRNLESRQARLFGPVKDLTEIYFNTGSKMKKEGASIKDIREALFKAAKAQGLQPVIISGIVNGQNLEKGVTPADVRTGWRLMPQSLTPDSAAFQQLVYDRVGAYKGKNKPFTLALVEGKPVKGYPMGIELMALLGSNEAQVRLITKGDEIDYEGYPNAYTRAKGLLTQPAGLPSQNLMLMSYWLKRGETSESDPSRRLNTCLGFWTRLRHATLLYSKQSYTIAGKGISMTPERTTAWITPAPELYLYLENMIRQLQFGLDSERLTRFKELLKQCREIAFKETLKEPLDKKDIHFLNSLDETLLPLTGGKDEPVVVDVHTDPTAGMVVEEAIGCPREITRNAAGIKPRGALFSYYEFKHPMKDRLTDEEWQVMLGNEKYEIRGKGKRMKDLELSPGSTRTRTWVIESK